MTKMTNINKILLDFKNNNYKTVIKKKFLLIRMNRISFQMINLKMTHGVVSNVNVAILEIE